jgi:transposase InsO family protein
VTRVLDQVGQFRGLPQVIRTDQGPEFTGNALDRWAYRNRVTLRLIQAGNPTRNAYVESFNGKFRDDCLDEDWFRSLAEARQAGSKHLRYVQQHGLYELILGTKKGVRSPESPLIPPRGYSSHPEGLYASNSIRSSAGRSVARRPRAVLAAAVSDGYDGPVDELFWDPHSAQRR